MAAGQQRPRVLILGAGFAGLWAARRLVGTDRGEHGYDHLLIAMGSVSHYFGVSGAGEHAFPLRTMEEGLAQRNHVLARFEKAAHLEDPRARRRALRFVIVGGDPTGVEFAGALAELLFGPLAKDHPTLAPDFSVILLEAQDRLLGAMPARLGRYAADRLQGMGVQVRPTLEVEGFDRFWAAGDLAYLERDGEALPMIAPVAIQQGEHAAESILRRLEGRDAEPFAYRDRGMLATIGRNKAVAHVSGRAFTGFPAWLLWLGIHIVKLIGFRNRIVVLVNWAWDYFFFERAVRLVLPRGLAPRGEEGGAEGGGGPGARGDAEPSG